MPIKNLAANYCSLVYADWYLEKNIDTRKINYEDLKSLASESILTLKQVVDLEKVKTRLFEKKVAVDVIKTEMKVIEQNIFNLLEQLNVNAIDYPYLENTFRFHRETINHKIVVEIL